MVVEIRCPYTDGYCYPQCPNYEENLADFMRSVDGWPQTRNHIMIHSEDIPGFNQETREANRTILLKDRCWIKNPS